MGERHLVIDWRRHFAIGDMKVRLAARGLLCTHVMEHDKLTHKKDTMRRFYNTPVNDSRGDTPFNVFFVVDRTPVYARRVTSRGVRRVNATLFDFKQELRSLVDGGSLVLHATDCAQETEINLQALELSGDFYTV